MHGLIGYGAFARNPVNANITFRCLPEPPNPKWLDHRGEPGAINFLSPPKYSAAERERAAKVRLNAGKHKHTGGPVFDRGGGSASPTWGGSIAANVNPAVTSKIGADLSRPALERAAETARTASAGKRTWGDLRWHGKMHAKPSSVDGWTRRNREHNKYYRDPTSWGPSLSIVPEMLLARRYLGTQPPAPLPSAEQFTEWRARVGFPEPIAGTLTWRRHDVLAFERARGRRIAVEVKVKGAIPLYVAPNHEHGGHSLSGLLSYTHLNMATAAAHERSRAASDPVPHLLARDEWDRLAALAKDGDEAALNKLFAAAVPVARGMARRLGSSRLDREYVADESISDLLSVLVRWEAAKGGGFLAFLRQHIEWRIKNANRSARSRPTEISLHKPVGEDGAVLGDFIGDDSGPDDEFDHDAARAQLDQRMQNLTERERLVIARRYCLDGETIEPTLEELGAEIGLSRETIRKDEIAAEQKLGLRG